MNLKEIDKILERYNLLRQNHEEIENVNSKETEDIIKNLSPKKNTREIKSSEEKNLTETMGPESRGQFLISQSTQNLWIR